MHQLAWIQLIVYLVVLLLLAQPLSRYILHIYEAKPPFFMSWLVPLEQLIYRLCAIHPEQSMSWKRYGFALICFNGVGLLWVYALQRWQAYLPFNPQHLSDVSMGLALNTAISFVTNTNWQSYAGETTMSYLTQMLALTSQNFLSAATGMSLLMVLIRGMVRHHAAGIGHFWVDLVRGTLYILLPLSCILSVFLISQGVIQTLKPAVTIHPIQPIESTYPSMNGFAETHTIYSNKKLPTAYGLTEGSQDIVQSKSALRNTLQLPLGPVASQVAIKQLGSNGGGFFNANAAHPFENPTPWTNFLEMLAILLIPTSFCLMFGRLVGDRRQGWALLAAMLVFFIPSVLVTVIAEQQGHSALTSIGLQSHENMEGKEVRFGIVSSALWSVATTASSNGAVNSMLDSYTPIGGLIPLWMMHLGEVVFGGVGSGLYNLFMAVIMTVFIAGLMVGRTPEYLGKKIEPFEIKMAAIALLIMPICVLFAAAVSVLLPTARQSLLNPGAHGLTEMLYAITSMVNNNGSAFAGLQANTPYFNIVGSILMLIGRYAVAIPVLAIAGSLLEKKTIPNTLGTLQTHTPLFVILLIGVILLLGALSFLPVLALGPIAEELMYG